MDALREYSPSISDEEITNSKNGGKPTDPSSILADHDKSPNHDHSNSSPSPPSHKSKSKRQRSPERHRQRSPERHRQNRRSRSPRPHHRRHSRSPPSRHRRTSRSPPLRRDNKGGGSYRSQRRSPSGSGGRSQDRHGRRDSSDYRHNEDNRSYKRSSERRDHTHHDPPTKAPTWSSDGSLTPEQKLEKALATSNKPQQAAAAVGLPKYINPSVINPHHFKVVQEKRKLLWGKKKEQQQQDPSSTGSWNKWESASFEGDDKGETQMKFRRLMGIKDGGSKESGGGEHQHKSNKLLDNLEAQYEASRFMTHLAKGAGLGYGSNALISQNKVDPNDTDDINESSHHR